MKKIQNFFLAQSQFISQGTHNLSNPVTPKHKNAQKKSIPKFHRKTEVTLVTHKPSQLKFQQESPICYISPKKSLTTQDTFFKSPRFQQITERLRQTLNQQSFKDIKENLNLEQFKDKMQKKGRAKHRYTLSKNQMDMENRQKENLLYQIQQLKNQNLDLKKKLQELERVQEFLIQRETYIYEISQINIKNQQCLTQLRQKNVELTDKLVAAQKQIQEQKQKFRKVGQELQHCIQDKSKQIQRYQSEVSSLKDQLKYLKQQSLKFNSFSKKCKQEIPSTSLKKARNPIKLKNFTIQSQSNHFTNFEPKSFEQVKSFEDDNKQNELKGILNGLQPISQLDDSDSFLAYKQENSELLKQVQNQPETQNSQDHEIKKLKQKIRYCEIQIDVLNKVKVDSEKIKSQNEKVKALNKKYLNRIDYFTRRYSRRSGSDSSLQLSLTPKKRNDLN